MSVVSTGSLSAALENILSPETAPDLFVFDRYNKMPLEKRVESVKKDSAKLIDFNRRRNFDLFPAA